MPSIKDLKKRIGSVKNTQQTTKAMKMVSASKLRRAQEAIVAQRPYARKLGDLIHQISLNLTDDLHSKLISKELNPSGEAAAIAKALLVIVTSDRGLCGGFNSSVTKATQRWIEENKKKYSSIKLYAVGKKGFEFFKLRRPQDIAQYREFGAKVTFAKAKEISEWLVNEYLNDSFDEIFLVYNEFKNAITQQIVVEPFLPLNAGVADISETHIPQAMIGKFNPELFLYRPRRKELLEALLRKHFSVQILRALLESQASEHGARMSSMENATKNAGEMIRKLTLLYNKQRQASITRELLEIISGSESQKA